MYSSVLKFEVSTIYLFKKLTNLFSKDALNWLKVTINIFLMSQKISVLCTFKLSVYQRILEKKIHSTKNDAAQVLSASVIINVSWAANQYIRMISEGSCYTKY